MGSSEHSNFHSNAPKAERHLRVALFPDSLTHYRVPVFNNLADDPRIELDVYASSKSGFSAMKLGDSEECYFKVIENRGYFWKGKQFYQSKVFSTVLSGRYDVVIVWGVCWLLSH